MISEKEKNIKYVDMTMYYNITEDVSENKVDFKIEGVVDILGDKHAFFAETDLVNYIGLDKDILMAIPKGYLDINGVKYNIVIKIQKKKIADDIFMIMSLYNFEEIQLFKIGDKILKYDVYYDNDVPGGKIYVKVDESFSSIKNKDDSNKIIKGELYIQKEMTEGYPDGTIRARFQYNSDEIIS